MLEKTTYLNPYSFQSLTMFQLCIISENPMLALSCSNIFVFNKSTQIFKFAQIYIFFLRKANLNFIALSVKMNVR